MRLPSPSSPTCSCQSSATRFQRAWVSSYSPLLIALLSAEREGAAIARSRSTVGAVSCCRQAMVRQRVGCHALRSENTLLISRQHRENQHHERHEIQHG